MQEFRYKIKSYSIKYSSYLKAENVKILMNKLNFDAAENKEEKGAKIYEEIKVKVKKCKFLNLVERGKPFLRE